MTYYAEPNYIRYDKWFDDKINPLDLMPKKNAYSSRHESTPEHEKAAEEIVTMHEKMYRIATDRYNPFSVSGSENCHADIDCPIGGSEIFHEKA